ncbi:MAG: hypothetical protein Q7J32_02385 [Sphingomonadaceae bacterium]|nr:hypothetical protein [Sphingomonadaceae bacterium]
MNYGLIEILFTSVTVLGLALWQLWSVTREIKRDKAAKLAKGEPPAG